jgi:YbgC/YbaW family acyl-CoA thioester hydrolase
VFLFAREQLKQLAQPGLASRPPHAFVEQRPVRFQDVDAAGIIFYPRVLEYFHDLYVAFLAQAGSPLPQILREKPWISPVRHAEADYLKPLRFGDTVSVALVAAHVEPSEVTLGYRLACSDTDELTGLGQVVHTFLDPATFKRIAIPDTLQAAYRALGPKSGGANG